MKGIKHLLLKALLLCVILMIVKGGVAQNNAMGESNIDKGNDTAPYTIKLSDVLKSFKLKFGVDILFEDKVVEGLTVSTEQINTKEPAEVSLGNLLNTVGLTYKKIKDKTYLVVVAKKKIKAKASFTDLQTVPSGKESDPKMAKEMAAPEKKSTNETGLVEIMPIDIIISGTVKDENGKIMQGVTVKERGTNNVGITNEKGIFKIKVQKETAVLEFSSINYVAQIAVAKKNQNLNIVLKLDEAKKLEDVVVVGYGTSKRSDLTGAISSIKAKDLQGAQINTIQDALQGRIAGLQMTSGNAAPGETATIRIRGVGSLGTSSDPLYVIDGYPSSEDITSINPNDIETIDVLKDASATAIYGSRGANGVIMITTKKGSRNGKVNIDADVYQGAARISNKLDLMNARQYAEYRNQINAYTNTALPFASPYLLDYYSTHNTDWQDVMFRTAPVTSVNLSLSGGDAKTRYLISGNYFKQQGIVQNTAFSRASLRFNFDREITNKLKFNIITTITKTLNNRTLINTAGGNAGGIVLGVIRTNPVTPVYDSTGNYSYNNIIIKDPSSASDPLAQVEQIGNPLAYEKRSVDQNNSLRMQVNVSLEYEIIKDLKFKTLIGGQYNPGWRDQFVPYDLYEQRSLNGSAAQTNNFSSNWINEDYLTYTKNYSSKYSITALVGTSFQVSQVSSATAYVSNLGTNTFSYNNLGYAGSQGTTSSASKNQLESFFSRVNLKLFTNLLLTANFRADGSSKFGADKKYGYFPSAAAAYKLSNLKWIRKVKIISDAKIRLGYGITGNQEIGAYGSLLAYANAQNVLTGGNGSAGHSTFGSTSQPAIAVNTTQPQNRRVQWEQTASINTGIDLSFFNNRLNLTADYYVRTTDHLLWAVPLPSTSGFYTGTQNLGKLENKGFELALTGKPMVKKNFTWSSTATFAVNKNTIIDMGPVFDFPYGGQLGLQIGTLAGLDQNFIDIKPGLSIGTFVGAVSDGIWQSQDEINKSAFSTAYKTSVNVKPGSVKYRDLNGDGKIDKDDRKIIGNASPKFTAGFINTFTYKSVELTIFLQGQQGNKVLNLNKYYTETVQQANKATYIKNSWTGEGTSNILPGVALGYTRFIDNTIIEDGSYLRIKTVTLGYNLPENSFLVKRAKLRSLKVYATATNLYTFTHYSGYDPEVGSYNNNQFAQGIDYGAYPVSKSLLIGLKIGL
ncbi:SusC/RagA family TonB-linked outer membrane protein [Parasediminibacterium sp. JCM 36343]|uniref:SusC/RagA family TonB-linked outer membrane protein n=1 Tax=Parasediminibacterium sp. JCM 36343 TaxID=3374279 RepID=UPI0039796D2E